MKLRCHLGYLKLVVLLSLEGAAPRGSTSEAGSARAGAHQAAGIGEERPLEGAENVVGAEIDDDEEATSWMAPTPSQKWSRVRTVLMPCPFSSSSLQVASRGESLDGSLPGWLGSRAQGDTVVSVLEAWL